MTSNLVVRIPEELFKQIGGDPAATGLAILAEARSIVIRDQATFAMADEFRKVQRHFLELIDEAWNGQIAQANALHKSLIAKRDEYSKPRHQALEIVNGLMAHYLEEQDRIRLQAERERYLAEEKAKRAAEAAIDKAAELMKDGKAEEAAEVMEKAKAKVEEIQAAAPVVPDKPEADVSKRTTWDFEVTNINKVPRKYLVVNEKMVRGIVTNLKDQTRIAGIRAYSKVSISDRSKD